MGTRDVTTLKRKLGKVILTALVVVATLFALRALFAPTFWGTALGGNRTQNFEASACTSLKHCAFVGPLNFAGTLEDDRVVISKIPGLPNPKTTGGFDLSSPLLTSVSCPTQKLCVAISSVGQLVGDYMNHWFLGGHLVPHAEGLFTAISCASNSFCMVGSNYGDAYLLDGGSWKDIGNPTKSIFGEILDVACPEVGTCFVATGQTNFDLSDGEGQIFIYSHGIWTAQTTISPNAIESISCAGKNFCIAGTSGDEVLTYKNGLWSTPRVITSDEERIRNSEWIVSVSCSSRSFCAALSTNFYVYTWNGHKWDSGSLVDSLPATPIGVNAISCFTGGRCVVAAQNIWLHTPE